MKTILWILVILAMIALTINTLREVITEYSEQPVNVIIKMERKTELAFPAVTFCNINPTRRSQLYKSPLLNSVFLYDENLRRKRNGMLCIIIIIQ